MALRSESDPGWAVPIEHVDRVDEADLLRPIRHHERVRPRAAAEEAHALEQVAARDARGREDQAVARREVVRAVHPVLVAVAHPGAPFLLFGVAVSEARLDLAAQTAQGAGGDDTL